MENYVPLMPARWVRLVKEAIRTVMPRFSVRRMGKEYAERMYASAGGYNRCLVARGAPLLQLTGPEEP